MFILKIKAESTEKGGEKEKVFKDGFPHESLSLIDQHHSALYWQLCKAWDRMIVLMERSVASGIVSHFNSFRDYTAKFTEAALNLGPLAMLSFLRARVHSQKYSITSRKKDQVKECFYKVWHGFSFYYVI